MLKLKALSYLDSLTTPELLGYGVIGLATLTRSTLNLVISAFPYAPLWLVKALIYRNYCGGDNLAQVLQTGDRLAQRGIQNMMLSLTIEACDGAQTSVPVSQIVAQTQQSVSQVLAPHTAKMISHAADINCVPPGYVALKPTGLIDGAAEILRNHSNAAYEAGYQQLLSNCRDICRVVAQENEKLAKQYPARTAPFVAAVVDAERSDLQHGVYRLQRDLFREFNRGKVNVVGTVQMYLQESSRILAEEKELASKDGYLLGWKLVRGAYIHSEPDRTVIFATKQETDQNYDAGIAASIADMGSEKPTVGHLVVASHNRESQLKATQLLQGADARVRANVVLGQLLGMADNITFELMNKYDAKNVIKYVPWGPPKETKEYLLRRLEENGDAVRSDNGWPFLKQVVKALFRRL
ncbi:hypothetical protein KL919_000488 [Ogataea angusta]|uniref:Proline dehydrogenase n=1 Tax=Pichia angusta TaxID=870730 RepID=A0AAN6I7C4_PICAN|nr:uncharacterized protein KL928_000301 [Ogataea angusta]KAG7821826.1 hypothetical protein KL928_000301 [Ogataea angusta]KAG7825898.1 hypothetical protein KL909_001130 [Ogataea angusta]KAG7837117.1 hypothetical protein KL943_001156 [Ogataea angusta]KAG7853248.1 hypothetical protein KL941_000298 [Ogataea angusta]KAG7863173.1 hypothetical protein KL939_000492 [Ogataea angusta]